MDAVIMAAGLGTRLRPHTLTTPKPLLPVKGRPILDWALGALPPQVDRVLVVVNYLAEQIESYLAKQKHVRRLVWRGGSCGIGELSRRLARAAGGRAGAVRHRVPKAGRLP
jgi:NDP-sugar pyrophosphorylase family protein